MTSASSGRRPHTRAGKQYNDDLIEWLQDSRLLSEAVVRLQDERNSLGEVRFRNEAWPKPRAAERQPSEFRMTPVQQSKRVAAALGTLWTNRFVFLESLWEEYLQNIIQDIHLANAALFEDFTKRMSLGEVIRDVLLGRCEDLPDLKERIASEIAALITRRSWAEQWNDLIDLGIGLSKKDRDADWFKELDTYFEMRNCIVHRQCRVSERLRHLDSYYAKRESDTIEVKPAHLDHYRHQFIECMLRIEEAVHGFLNRPRAPA